MAYSYDPRFIPRPAMFPMARPAVMTTQNDGLWAPVHSHRAYPDSSGNGSTDPVASHHHEILNWKILPSPADGHTHSLTHIRCGAGRV